jgi:hypothetical protein
MTGKDGELLQQAWEWVCYWRWRSLLSGMNPRHVGYQELVQQMDAWETPGAWNAFCERIKEEGIPIDTGSLPWLPKEPPEKE